MLTRPASGNISDEATARPGNIFVEAMRHHDFRAVIHRRVARR
jgi:hypothetical protein